jgi:hypothetical protein
MADSKAVSFRMNIYIVQFTNALFAVVVFGFRMAEFKNAVCSTTLRVKSQLSRMNCKYSRLRFAAHAGGSWLPKGSCPFQPQNEPATAGSFPGEEWTVTGSLFSLAPFVALPVSP